MKYKRILLKISGESFKKGSDIYNYEKMTSLAKQVIELTKQGVEVGIVIGAGNIWRGKLAVNLELNKIDADYMGMLATIMNALAFEGTIRSLNFDNVKVYSALDIRTVTTPYNYRDAREKLSKGFITIFAAGTGFSHFSTDTGASIRAIEIGADALLFAKNGVKGVYDSDPKQNPNAKFLKRLTYKEIVEKDLKVMDSTASTVCSDANMKIIIFDVNKNNSIVDVLNDKIEYSIIEK